MEVLDKITILYSVLMNGLQAAHAKFETDCEAACSKLEAKFAQAKTNLAIDGARRKSHGQVNNTSVGRAAAFHLHNDFRSAAARVPSEVRLAGLYFIFTAEDKERLGRLIGTLPDTVENHLDTILSLVAERMLSTERETSILETFYYIKALFAKRWDDLQVAQVGADDIMSLTLTNWPWASMANEFVALVSEAFKSNMIDGRHFKQCVPAYTQKDAHGQITSHADFHELFFPKIKRHFEESLNSFRAKTGLFWVPGPKDIQVNGDPLPIRLYTPIERVILEDLYGTDLRGYTEYFVTKEHCEPSIQKATFVKLWRLVEEALLIEYTVSLESHERDVKKLIAKQIEEKLLVEYVDYMQAEADNIDQIIEENAELKLKREQLIDYQNLKTAGAYNIDCALSNNDKNVLLAAYSALTGEALQDIKHLILNKILSRLEEGVTQVKQIEDELLAEYKKHMEDHAHVIEQVIREGAEETTKSARLIDYVSLRKAGAYGIERTVSGHNKDVLLAAHAALTGEDLEATRRLIIRKIFNKLDSLTQSELFAGLRDLQDEKLELFTAQFMIKYNAMEGWSGGIAERKRLENQVLCLKGIYTDSKVITYTTFANLMYLMCPENRASSTCAHTIWGRLLFLLCDYNQSRSFEGKQFLDDRIEGRFDEYLAIARERSRSRSFYQGSISTWGLFVMNSDEDEQCLSQEKLEDLSEGSTDPETDGSEEGVDEPQGWFSSLSTTSSDVVLPGSSDDDKEVLNTPVAKSPIRQLMEEERRGQKMAKASSTSSLSMY
ncbi:MAG: hypothetical protein K0U37_09450 [Gammaproteobacteria bacterium]|nr:hypothetical protein [Gammaproteobacteria bacterium]